MELAHRGRQLANGINLSTPIGVLLAHATGCAVRRGPRGLYLADGYRPRFPYAGAFTVGNVLIARDSWAHLHEVSPELLRHEEGHTWQWATLGPLFLPAYGVAMAWSWLRCGDRSSANWFEVRAGLDLGGYVRRPKRSLVEGFAALGALVLRRCELN